MSLSELHLMNLEPSAGGVLRLQNIVGEHDGTVPAITKVYSLVHIDSGLDIQFLDPV